MNKGKATREAASSISKIESLTLSPSEKATILLGLLGQMQGNRLANEAVEHKATLAIVALLIGLAAYVVKGDYYLNWTIRYGLATFSAVIAGLTIWFLLQNGRRIRKQCQVIVRIEQALGFYEEGAFITADRVAGFAGKPFETSTLYPLEAQRYGRGDWALVLGPQILLVTFAAAIAAVVVLADLGIPIKSLPEPNGPTPAYSVSTPSE